MGTRLEIIIIAAMTPQRVIGLNNTIPWDIPSEQQFFKFVTMGHTLLMGRKTYESIGKPLPGRKNIVLTSHKLPLQPDLFTATSSEQGLSLCSPGEKVFVIGGASIYKQLLPKAHRLLLTTIHKTFPGDTVFPPLPPGQFSGIGTVHVHDTICYTIREFVRNK